MRILLTGSEGYIGAVLGPALADAGYEVTGLDAGFFRQGRIQKSGFPSLPVIRKDTREVRPEDLAGYGAIVHLAELSNDPLGELDPALTEAINFKATVRLGRLAREAGVPRFVYFSSCSVYGIGSEDGCVETSETRPQTAYARAKLNSENVLRQLASPGFAPVILRNATVFGPSPSMRLDLVVNNLAASACLEGEVRMVSDGSPWRPLIHIQDLCRAARMAIEAPASEVRGEIFNCGDSRANYRIAEIAEAVREAFPGARITAGGKSADSRSYRVCFDKIRARLGFEAAWTVHQGARQLRQFYEELPLRQEDLQGSKYFRCKLIRQLLEEGRLGQDLRWTGAVGDDCLPPAPGSRMTAAK